jgi:hypothetical protein
LASSPCPIHAAVVSQNDASSVLPAVNINMVPAISLAGDLGATYRIDYLNAIGSTNTWNALGTITVTNGQQYYVYLSAIGQPARLYRLVQVP